MTITDEMLERAAKAAFEAFTGSKRFLPWERINPITRSVWLRSVRAALEAALSAKEDSKP